MTATVFSGISVFALAVMAVVIAGSCFLIYLGIKALMLYISSHTVREEKRTAQKTLGEVIKANRMKNQMTQEFVAESLGVSRQAVSKWESGRSTPSTANLMVLARLFGVTPEELLRECREETTES